MKGQIIHIQDAFELANWYQQAGKLKKAERICNKILKITPENAHARYLLGMGSYLKGNHEKAIQYIREAIRNDPEKD